MRGLIYNIQKYTIHDGPGIRTEFFFKGCPLSCPWCSNPEGMGLEPEIGVYPSRCIGREKCSFCLKACPKQSDAGESPIRFGDDGILTAVNQDDFCADCLKCANVCPGRAIMVWGYPMSVEELLKIAEEDRSFYERSGGGVTVSGGDIMAQWEFVAAFLKACHEAGLNTCAESTFYGAWEHAKAIAAESDLLIADIKFMDTERHKKYTGVGNESILRNLERFAEEEKPLVVRTPVVPGINDSEEEILKIGQFIKERLGGRIVQYQLLPYRKMGTEKYATLNRPYPMDEMGYIAPEREVWEPKLLALAKLLNETYGIPAVAGSAQKLFPA